MGWKKRRFFAAFAAALILLLTPAWGAEDYDYRGRMEEFFDESGAQDLADKLPDETKGLLDRLDLDGIGGMVEGFTPKKLADALLDSVKSCIRAPARMLVSLVGVLVLCAMLESFGSSFASGGVEAVFGVVVTVFISSIIIDPIVACVVDARAVIEDHALFILSFIPVFAGVVSASGQPMTGTAYTLLVFWMCQLTARLVTAVFLPLLCCYLALSLTAVVCPKLKLEGFIIESLQSYRDNARNIAVVTLDMMRRSGATEDDCDDLASLAGKVRGNRVSITVRELTPGASKGSIRTDGSVDANAVCARFGGGGHKMAAGCKQNLAPEELAERLRAAVEALWPV